MKENNMKYYKYKLNTLTLNILAICLMLVLGVFIFLTYDGVITRIKISEIIIMVIWFILHELFHYIGFLTAKDVKPKDLALGMYVEKGIFYCMCKKQINKKSILISLMFPLFFLGIVTMILGYIFNSFLLVFLSAINIAGAIGDIIMFIQICKFPNDITYTDVDDATGYYIISKHNLDKIKVPSIYLEETGKYKESIFKHKDNRKIVITKTSAICLAIIIILFILSIFKII